MKTTRMTLMGGGEYKEVFKLISKINSSQEI